MDQSLFKYDIVAEDPKTHARAGVLHTPHGDVETPIFMPVGTKANVKGIPTETVKALGAQIVLANTYHLSMRPGEDLIDELGGLHNFMNWHGPILTDSGGFQVFSHNDAVKLSDDGVRFIVTDYDGLDARGQHADCHEAGKRHLHAAGPVPGLPGNARLCGACR